MMTNSERRDAEYWRKRAQEMRAWAADLHYTDKQAVRQIVQSYEILARCAETLERSKNLLNSD
jgi:hypothetical protein